MPSPKLSPLTRGLLAGLPIAQPPEDFAIPTNPAGGSAAKKAKLWDLADKHHCPVIGTCIPASELERFAKRFRFTANLRDHFALHVEMVGHSRTRNEVSEALQRHLDKKYQPHLAQFAKLKDEAGVRSEWKACLARGEVAGALWAAYTHRASTDGTRQMVYGDIHMLSHQVGAGQAADSRRLAYLEKENAKLKDSLRQLEKQAANQAEALRKQEGERARDLVTYQCIRAENEALRQRLAAFESGQVVIDLGRKLVELRGANEQLQGAASRTRDLEDALQTAQEENARLLKERDAVESERKALEGFLSAMASSDGVCDGPSGGDCATCAGEFSSRCILYVGGRASMISHYRQLADRLGINLIHHDGGVEESLSRLPELIHGADAVVCPTDNISHSAYYQVKSHCKRVGKPCLFYKGAGVSSFAVAMTRVSRGEFSVVGTSNQEA